VSSADPSSSDRYLQRYCELRASLCVLRSPDPCSSLPELSRACTQLAARGHVGLAGCASAAFGELAHEGSVSSDALAHWAAARSRAANPSSLAGPPDPAGHSADNAERGRFKGSPDNAERGRFKGKGSPLGSRPPPLAEGVTRKSRSFASGPGPSRRPPSQAKYVPKPQSLSFLSSGSGSGSGVHKRTMQPQGPPAASARWRTP
jgi:hypothetical protein